MTTGVSIFSFIGVYDGELFWDHMVQHLLLIMVAAPLFAIASPLELAWRSTTGTAHVVVTEALRSKVAKFLGHPVVAFVLYAVLIPISHLTSLVQPHPRAREHPQRRAPRLLVVGYLFWRQIFGDDPNKYRLHPALQFFYLFLAIPIDTFTGLSLAGATQELFPAYLATHRTWGPSYVVDLHTGGTIMWVVGDTLDALADDPGRAALDAPRGAQGGTGRPRARRPGSGRAGRHQLSPEVHQLDAHAVGVRAVDELERRPAEVDRRPAGLDDRAAELDDPGRRRRHVGDPERKVGQSQLVDRPPGRCRRTGSARGRPAARSAVGPRRMNCDVTATSGRSISAANSDPISCDSAFSKPRAPQ